MIEINVTNKRPAVIGTPVIVCGNSDYSIQFTFDAEWAAHTLKTARFVYTKAGAVQHKDVPFSGNVVAVPVLSGIRDVFVGVYAGDLRTTTPARIPCDKSILCGGGTHEEPPEDVYNQILEVCNAMVATAATQAYVNTAAAKAAPWNLLDNSDFSNPVAQAGLNGKHGNYTYVADRWLVNSGEVTAVQLSKGVRFTSGSNTSRFLQKMPYNLAGKTVTIAAKLGVNKAAFIGLYYVIDGTTKGLTWNTYEAFTGVACVSGTIPVGATDFDFRIYPGYVEGGAHTDVYWAAVYEGEYTVETLPEYRPKGYGAELAECQRYYIPLTSECVLNGYLSNVGDTAWLEISTPSTMRVKPTIVNKNNGNIGVRSVTGAKNFDAGKLTFAVNYLIANGVVITIAIAGATFTPSTPCCLYFGDTVELCADL